MDVVQNLMFYIEAAYKVAVSAPTHTHTHTHCVAKQTNKVLSVSVGVLLIFGPVSAAAPTGLWDVGERRQNQPGHHRA